LQSEKRIVIDQKSNVDAVYTDTLHAAELGLASKILNLANAKNSRIGEIPAVELLSLDEQLSEEQLGAVQTALNNPLSILTGGPGTGKTTTVRALIAALETANKRYALASPTGRAAKRLSQATDRPAGTLHRLLSFSPQEGFKHNQDNPLALDFLVVDESSMLDLQLAYSLVKALDEGTHLLLVGDVDQLPSVGAGDVLRELIISEIAPLTILSVIFRQAEDSFIITNAHLINQGQMPQFPKESEDFFIFPAENGQESIKWIRDLLTDRIPKRFNLDPLSDVQVLAPIYRGDTGVNAINAELQAALNPGSALKAERSFFGQTMRVGDKLMQVKNDYDKNVFNGDIGQLREISNENQLLTIEFEGRQVEYDWSEADQLTLAYAITVHKSQGSEFPAVVMPILTQHFIMLQRNLIYTAITRAKSLCVLVANKKAIAIAVKNNKVSERWSGLAERLAN
jgi:exodeoxyribonuclease V alpha subunit